MAFLAGMHDGSVRMKSHTSPRSTATSALLAEGYTEDGQLSPFDSIRRQSQYSLASTLGARLSIASGANLDDNHVIDEMLHRIGSHRGSVRVDRPNIPPRKPDSWLGKAKYYYDKFNLRYVAPFGLLLVYSIVGAFIFYWVEYENEQEMLRQEALILERLRNETFHRLKEVITDRIRSDQTKLYNSRDVLVWYEKQLAKLHLPEGLEWDMWGALFYVGTLFTTIGYGNIAPRTTFGQALSIMYAIVGIPLVLAILNQFGKTLTKFLSSLWIKYRQCIKAFTKRKRIASKMRTSRIWGERLRQKQDERDLLTVEEGGVGNVPQTNHSLLNNPNLEDDFLDDELLESRTIPVWLALFLCVAWICACAGLFCLWETRWSYFTSLYFFFISLSTIGLGDVVPDHPHMLILMFWLVIIGLSIVSMLLSVIQIKIEEWLYHLMIRMRKEYQRALANGDPVERQAILNKLMKKEPWFMRNMAQHLISENQAAELDHQAETFERSVCQVNNKNIQTEPPNLIDSIIEQSDNETQLSQQQQFNNMSTDAASLASELITSPLQADMSTQWSVNTDMRSESRTLDMPRLESALPVSNMMWQSQDTLESFSDAISDATSPCKSIIEAVDRSMQVSAISCLDRSQQFDPLPASVCGVQTDIAQFQVDEIMLRLHEIQEKSKKKPMLMDRSMETSLQQFDAKDESGEENDKTEQISQSTQYDIAPVVVDISITADLNSQMVEEGTETEQNECLLNRSMETDAWMAQLQMPECSRSVQTHFDEDEVVELDELATKRTTSKQQVRVFDDNVNERSTQCEPQIKDTCDTCMQTMLEMCDFDGDSSARARSSSLVSLRGSTDTEEPAPVAKQDLIIQTDDSYLKIARRLDQIRNNRTASLHICAAKPLRFPQDDDPSNSNRQRSENLILFNEQPNERREFNVDPTRRKSLRRGADKPMRSPKSPIWPGKVVSFSMDSDAATIEEGPSNLSDSDTLQPRTDVS